MPDENANEILLRILNRMDAYRRLNQAIPELEDDSAMDSLVDQLIDALDAKLNFVDSDIE